MATMSIEVVNWVLSGNPLMSIKIMVRDALRPSMSKYMNVLKLSKLDLLPIAVSALTFGGGGDDWGPRRGRRRGLSPRGLSPGGLSPGGLSPGGLSPGGLSPGGLSPRGMSPGGLISGGLSPRGLSPRGLSPRGLSPGGLNPGGLSPEGLSPGGLSPGILMCCACHLSQT
ncbi:hypothetical protein H6P81_006941 [Aristolochia fimbriata]|uniref:Uncharacterized protein n=1 Tax=Aristolochia fimbriata TaxID=158543 RepID=A0AAV7F2L1_ARIFI|nr:hypothetical protein H6P81_006941 [Aristolochia fimbriata]